MIFCPKCGEAIPDGSVTCPKCGEDIATAETDQPVVYASQKTREEIAQHEVKTDLKKAFIVWGLLGALSLFFLNFNYMSVSISLYFGGSSDTDYSGYYLTKCLGGTAALSGWMVIILIVLCIAVIITSIMGIKGGNVNNTVLKKIMIVESLLYIIVTVIPLFHLNTLLKEFDSSLTTTGIGPGCYLNIAVAIASIVVYFKCFSHNLNG